MARTTSRRGALKMMGGAATAAVAAVVLKPFRADASCTSRGGVLCGDACCPAGVACINPRTSRCGCPSGQQACGDRCCPPNGTCTERSADCCCAPGLTPCGPSCCATGVACVNSRRGLCGCPAGYTQCVGRTGEGPIVRCCPPGQACSSDCPPASSFGTKSTVNSCGACIPDDDQCESGNQCCSGVCQGDCCSANGTRCDNNNVVCCGFCNGQTGQCQSGG